MDFNIKKYITELQKKTDFRKNESYLESLIEELSGVDLEGELVFERGVISFPSLPTALVVLIKKHKSKIIELAKKKKIYVRDIL